MPRFTPYHTRNKTIGVVDFQQNRTKRLPIPIGHRYQELDMRLKVELAHGGGAAAANPAQEAVLAIIESMFIKVNGGDERYITNGQNIFVQSFKQIGKAPNNFSAPTLNASGTYDVRFKYRPYPTAIMQRAGFSFDLLNEAGSPSAISTADLHVTWGSVDSIFNTVGDMSIVSATLEVEGVERMLPPVTAVPRDWEYVTRQQTFTYESARKLSEELLRVENSRLIGMSVVASRNGIAVPFSNDEAIVKVIHDDYDWKRAAIWQLETEMAEGRPEAVPSNMLFIDLVENFDLNTSLLDGNFGTKDLKLELETILDTTFAGTAGHEINVYLEYAKAPGT